MEVVVDHREDNQRTEYEHAPVHRNQRRVRYGREEDKDTTEEEIANRNEIHPKTRSPQAETSRQERFPDKALPYHAAYYDDVGGEHGGVSERDDDVEGDGGADDDETKHGCGEECEHDRVDGDVAGKLAVVGYLNELLVE